MEEFNDIRDGIEHFGDDMFGKPVSPEKSADEDEPPMWFFDETSPFSDWLFEED